jgi:UDP-N-acetyl-D-mannosaminuronate dehydrogenase
MSEKIVVVGLGEVGRPLLELVERAGYEAVGVDIDTALPDRGATRIMHICFPYEIPDFVGETVRYINLLDPELTIIDSTVAVGTTREVHSHAERPIAHSPVRGKHSRMLEELTSYAKYVGGVDGEAGELAAAHFRSLGMPVRIVSSPEATELAKLTETTYFGLMIAWAQEVERYCDLTGQNYEEIVSFYEEIPFFPPVKYFPGEIGGHCVMPNIDILSKLVDSEMQAAIKSSNRMKKQRGRRQQAA